MNIALREGIINYFEIKLIYVMYMPVKIKKLFVNDPNIKIQEGILIVAAISPF